MNITRITSCSASTNNKTAREKTAIQAPQTVARLQVNELPNYKVSFGMNNKFPTGDGGFDFLMHAANKGRHSAIHNILENPSLDMSDEKIVELLLGKDIYGDLPIHYASEEKRAEVIFGILERLPEETRNDTIIQMLTTKGSRGNLPIHGTDAKGKLAIFKGLEVLPEEVRNETIVKMLLTKNNAERLPIHWAEVEDTEVIFKELGKLPEEVRHDTIYKMMTTKDIDGNLPVYCADTKRTEAIFKELGKLSSDTQNKLTVEMLTTKNNSGRLPIFGPIAIMHQTKLPAVIDEIKKLATREEKLNSEDASKLLDAYGNRLDDELRGVLENLAA